MDKMKAYIFLQLKSHNMLIRNLKFYCFKLAYSYYLKIALFFDSLIKYTNKVFEIIIIQLKCTD